MDPQTRTIKENLEINKGIFYGSLMKASLSVLLEVHNNTRSVFLNARHPLGAEVKMRLDKNNNRAILDFCDAESNRIVRSWCCALPKNVDWTEKPQLVRKDSEYSSIRLALSQLGPHDSVLLVSKEREAYTDVPRLQQLNNVMKCRKCLGVLVDGSPFTNVARLPSVYWAELAELWGCHSSTFAAAPKKEMDILKGTCYVGDVYAVLNNADVRQSNIKKMAGKMVCNGCGSVLGFARSNDSLSLYFHAVTDERGLWKQSTLEKRLGRQLFDLSQGNGVLRYYCAKVKLAVVLVNWDTAVSVDENVVPQAVLKVRYFVGDIAANDETGDYAQIDWDETEAQTVLQALNNHAVYFDMAKEMKEKISFLWMQ